MTGAETRTKAEGGGSDALVLDYMTVEDQRVASITLNRPGEGNRLTVEMIIQLTDQVTSVSAELSVRAIVLRGEGEDFCRGRDPGSSGRGGPKSALEFRRDVAEPILGLYEAIRKAETPVVAAVHGAAFGLGCALAGACDVTIASRSSRFSLPELGADLPPTLAISALADKVPLKALSYLIYTGVEIDATASVDLGIASCLVPDLELETEANRYLGAIVGASSEAVAAAKHYLLVARRMDPDTAASSASNLLSTVVSSR